MSKMTLDLIHARSLAGSGTYTRQDNLVLVKAIRAVEALCVDPEHHETQGPHDGYVSVENLRAAIREALG